MLECPRNLRHDFFLSRLGRRRHPWKCPPPQSNLRRSNELDRACGWKGHSYGGGNGYSDFYWGMWSRSLIFVPTLTHRHPKDEDNVRSSIMKIWDLGKTDKRTGAPVLLRTAKVQPTGKPHPVRSVPVTFFAWTHSQA